MKKPQISATASPRGSRRCSGVVLSFAGAANAPPLAIDGGRIAAPGAGRCIDLTGYLLLPGIVDLHGDAFERHVAPRRGAATDMQAALHALEAELAANGITTAWLAQFWSWEGGMRGPDAARRLAAALADYRGPLDLRLQLRVEIALHADFDAILALVDANRIGCVVLNDHLPHDRLAAGRRPPRLEGQALKSGRSPEAHHALLRRLHAEMPQARARLPGFVAALKARGVRIGQHDMASAADVAAAQALGVDFAEFPMTREAAEAARAAGLPAILGAPNALRGGSHGKGVSARDLIAAGLCDALASDYHYPTPHRAAFALADAGMPFAEAWGLIAERPARIFDLTDRGTLEPGQRADLVIIEAATRRVAGTICAGRIAHLSGALAERLIA